MNKNNHIHRFVSIMIAMTMILSGFVPNSVSAQGGGDDGRRQGNAQKGGDGIRRQVNPQSGRVSFIGPESGRVLPASKVLGSSIRPQDPGRALVNRFAFEFGIKNPGSELSEMKSNRPGDGHVTVRYQQTYQGIPVMGGELIVNTNENGDLYSMNGEVSPDLSLQVQPTIDSAQAAETALQEIAKQYQKATADFVASEPELWIYDESLLRPSTRPVELVWRMEVTAADHSLPVRELVLVDALGGNISLHFNQVDTAWSSSRNAHTLESAKPVVSTINSTRTEFGNNDPILQSSEDFTPQSAGVSWYVATTGDDADDCATTSTPCATINGAIGKATSGDTIYVATGNYIGTGTEVVLINKGVTLLGGWDSTFTIQDALSTIDGQSVRGGIYLDGSYIVTIDHFLITNGYTTAVGGGINNIASTILTLNDSVVSDNTAAVGGGIYNNGTLTLNYTVISNNTTQYNGAGINHDGGTLTLNYSTVSGNTATSSVGGGISSPSEGTLILNNSTVSDNTSSTFGGGIHKYDLGTLTLNNSTVSGNMAGDNGGGIYIFNSDMLVLNNSTVSDNSASYGGGIYIHNSVGTLQNSILAGNYASGSGSDCEGTIDDAVYSLIGNSSGCTFTTSSGSIIGTNSDPVNPHLAPLADNGGPTDTHALMEDSLAIDAGNPATPGSGGEACESIDQLGISRPVDGDGNGSSICDIGATEFVPLPLSWYVATTGNDSWSCSSTGSPCATITGAIGKATAGDAIYVATGTYTGSLSQVVLIGKNVVLSGGWNVGFTSQTGLSTIDGQNARRSVYVGYNTTTSLDHFIIKNGYISGSGSGKGGGIYNSYGNLTITDSSIQNNVADGGHGGGIYNDGGNLTITNSSIQNNSTVSQSGGGIYTYYGNLTITNSSIQNNTSSSLGGGIYTVYGTLTLDNTTISNNVATLYGGGIGINSSLNANNVTISNNTASSGGGVFLNASGIVFNNSILAGNTATDSEPDCRGTFTSNGYNLIGNNSGCSFTPTTGDLVGTNSSPINPRLTPLQDNGGSTFTHALMVGSPAIDAGNPATPGSGGNACLGTDQRGVARPVDAKCDIGAYEGSVAWVPTPYVSTYTANGTSSLPGTFLCDQNKQPCTTVPTVNQHADAAHKFAIGTYNFYAEKHLRDSIDNNGMTIISTVQYCEQNGPCPYDNAFWDGTQMVYGSAHGWPLADDIVAHELTHGVTEYESDLFYYYQSGAINESFSDLWGEYYDQTNGMDVNAGNTWRIGEDIGGWTNPYDPYCPTTPTLGLRDMSNPILFCDPDKMTSPYYYTGSADNGGVHWNSGVNNKAVYLMVTSLNWEKTGAIYYEAQTNLLTSASDYSDLYLALQQACTNLIGYHSIDAGNCAQVKNALDAVEMNTRQPFGGLEDPSFEYSYFVPYPYWDQYSYNFWTPLCTIADCTSMGGTAGPRTGSVWGWFGGTTDYETAYLSQTVYFPDGYPSTKLKFYLWIGRADAGSDANDKFTVLVDGLTVFTVNATQKSLYPVYTPVTVDLSSFATNALHTIKFSSVTSGQVVNFNLDDISLAAHTFADVPMDYWSWGFIERLYNAGVTSGCSVSPKLYCPTATVTRDQMAVFLLRGKYTSSWTPPPATGVFQDVPVDYWAADWIEQLAVDGITSGCSVNPKLYCPTAAVTRDQMAVFLLRAKHGPLWVPPPATGVFQDVPTNYWAADWIEQLAAEGITSGCSVTPKLYCPTSAVTRDQMAVFLVRNFNLP